VPATMVGPKLEAKEAEVTSEDGGVEDALLEALAAALKETGERQTEAMRQGADTTRVSR
jgi:hypothetical protein